MNDFDWDVLQKKKTASGAYHLKRGSRSKKCTLPSDILTASQRRELNGKMETYNLSDALDWGDFKKLPNDLKTEYMQRLVDTYDASQSMACKSLFCISDTTLTLYLKGNGLVWPQTKHGRKKPSKDCVDAFNAFCGKGSVEAKKEERVMGEPPKVSEKADVDTKVEAEASANERWVAEILTGSITLKGYAPDIASKLVSLLGANEKWKVSIEFQKE